MYPGQTDLFLNQYEEAAKRPFGYLLIDLKTTTQDNCRLRTNVLSIGEGFIQACFQENIPQELVKYIKRKIFRLSRFFQLFKRYTATWMTCFLETLKIFGMMKKLSDTFSCKTGTSFKEQLNTRTRPEQTNSAVSDLTSSAQESATATAAFSTPPNPFNLTPDLKQAAIL